jgi:hypothetical protein
MTALAAWLSRFPLRRRDVVVAVAGVSISAAAGNARAHVTHGAGPNATVNDRLEALEKNVVAIHARITQTQGELDSRFGDASKAVEAETRARAIEIGGVRDQLEHTLTGGLHISGIGASWFFFGTVLSSAAPEIAALLK